MLNLIKRLKGNNPRILLLRILITINVLFWIISAYNIGHMLGEEKGREDTLKQCALIIFENDIEKP